MDIKKELQLSLNDDNGVYNFIVNDEIFLKIDAGKISSDTVNEIFDGIELIMAITLSAAELKFSSFTTSN